jgi:hypothetical protein
MWMLELEEPLSVMAGDDLVAPSHGPAGLKWQRPAWLGVS